MDRGQGGSRLEHEVAVKCWWRQSRNRKSQGHHDCGTIIPAYFYLIKTIVILGVCWDEEVINRSGNTEKKTRKWLTWNSGDCGCLHKGLDMIVWGKEMESKKSLWGFLEIVMSFFLSWGVDINHVITFFKIFVTFFKYIYILKYFTIKIREKQFGNKINVPFC